MSYILSQILIVFKSMQTNSSPLLSLASMMTDRERDEIDEDVEQFIKICNEKAIKCLRNEGLNKTYGIHN